MSGGSYGYISHKIDDAVEQLRLRHPREPHVLTLADHLAEISTVLHDIEWADSCDTEWTQKLDDDIRALFPPEAEMLVVVRHATDACASLATMLTRLAATRGREMGNETEATNAAE